MEPRIQYAKTSDGVNIAWFAIGAGPPYIWMPSPPYSITGLWQVSELRNLLEGMARRVTLVVYDARGFGLSDRGPMDYSCEAMVRELEAVAVASGLHSFTLHSQSYMAIPAMMYAVRHSDWVTALVLQNGVMRGADLSRGWNTIVRAAREDWNYARQLLARSNEAGYSLTESLEQNLERLKQSATREAFLAFLKQPGCGMLRISWAA